MLKKIYSILINNSKTKIISVFIALVILVLICAGKDFFATEKTSKNTSPILSANNLTKNHPILNKMLNTGRQYKSLYFKVRQVTYTDKKIESITEVWSTLEPAKVREEYRPDINNLSTVVITSVYDGKDVLIYNSEAPYVKKTQPHQKPAGYIYEIHQDGTELYSNAVANAMIHPEVLVQEIFVGNKISVSKSSYLNRKTISFSIFPKITSFQGDKHLITVDEETGIILKWESFRNDKKEFVSEAIVFKINEQIPNQKFVFYPPFGIKIVKPL